MRAGGKCCCASVTRYASTLPRYCSIFGVVSPRSLSEASRTFMRIFADFKSFMTFGGVSTPFFRSSITISSRTFQTAS